MLVGAAAGWEAEEVASGTSRTESISFGCFIRAVSLFWSSWDIMGGVKGVPRRDRFLCGGGVLRMSAAENLLSAPERASSKFIVMY